MTAGKDRHTTMRVLTKRHSNRMVIMEKMSARIIENPLNIGGGALPVGALFEIIRETKCYYWLADNRRINKEHMSIAGTADHSHSVKVEIVPSSLW